MTTRRCRASFVSSFSFAQRAARARRPRSSVTVALRRQQKIDRLPDRIHGPEKILVVPLNLYVGFVDKVALVGAVEMRLATLVQFRRVDMNSTPNTAGIHFHSPLC